MSQLPNYLNNYITNYIMNRVGGNYLKDVDNSIFIGMVLEDAKKIIQNLENSDKIKIDVYYEGTEDANGFYSEATYINIINFLVDPRNQIILKVH